MSTFIALMAPLFGGFDPFTALARHDPDVRPLPGWVVEALTLDLMDQVDTRED